MRSRVLRAIVSRGTLILVVSAPKDLADEYAFNKVEASWFMLSSSNNPTFACANQIMIFSNELKLI